MKHSCLVGRFLPVLIALMVTASTVTAGVALRCGMAAHCGGCPEQTLVWAAPLECPLVLPEAPASPDAESPSGAALFAAPLGAGLSLPAPSLPAPVVTAPERVTLAPRPPGRDVLRI